MDTSRKNGANRAWAEGAPAGAIPSGNFNWQWNIENQHVRSVDYQQKMGKIQGGGSIWTVKSRRPKLFCFIGSGFTVDRTTIGCTNHIQSQNNTQQCPKNYGGWWSNMGFSSPFREWNLDPNPPHIGHSFPSVLGASRHFDGRGAPRWHGFKGWLGYDLHMYTYINHSTYSYTCIHTYIRTCMDACILPYMHSFHTDTHTHIYKFAHLHIYHIEMYVYTDMTVEGPMWGRWATHTNT